jgi:uroporphyrinogen-III synthase|tara:strand:+ start:2375 stop:3139 length:765 start_codon:yes stop_codon:yes gene_type:complete
VISEQGLLKGLSVVVTRASHQSATLIKALERENADVIAAPSIAIVPPLDGGQPLDDALLRLDRYSWVAFTSANAVAASLARGARRGVIRRFDHLKIAAVGLATAEKVLEEMKREVDLLPTVHRATELARAFPEPKKNDRVFVPMASEGRPDLAAGLRERGWDVDDVAAYRTVTPSLTAAVTEKLGNADMIIFASPSAVNGHIKQRGLSIDSKVVCIGDVTAEACLLKGIEVGAVAKSPSVGDLLKAVTDLASSH